MSTSAIISWSTGHLAAKGGGANSSEWMKDTRTFWLPETFQWTYKLLKGEALFTPFGQRRVSSVHWWTQLCQRKWIIMLSFPPHCSHRLQPLDRSVYGPLKRHINSTCDAWMRNNPGKTMSIYDIPGIVTIAYPLAATPLNIQAGFKVVGVKPYNRDVFPDTEFAPSYVTDRPIQKPALPGPSTNSALPGSSTNSALPGPSTNSARPQHQPVRSQHQLYPARPQHQLCPARPQHQLCSARPQHQLCPARPQHQLCPARPQHQPVRSQHQPCSARPQHQLCPARPQHQHCSALPGPSTNSALPGSSTNSALPGPSTNFALPGPSTNLSDPSTNPALPGPSTNSTLPGPSTNTALPCQAPAPTLLCQAPAPTLLCSARPLRQAVRSQHQLCPARLQHQLCPARLQHQLCPTRPQHQICPTRPQHQPFLGPSTNSALPSMPSYASTITSASLTQQCYCWQWATNSRAHPDIYKSWPQLSSCVLIFLDNLVWQFTRRWANCHKCTFSIQQSTTP